MLLRIWSIAWKELMQLRRDRLTLAMMVVIPIMQLLMFGYALNTDVRHMPTLVFDQDRSRASRDLVQTLTATGYYDIVGYVEDYGAIERALRSDRARVALVMPARYGSDITRGRPTQVQLIVDGSDPQTVASATNTASSLVGLRSTELLVRRFNASAAGTLAQDPLAAFSSSAVRAGPDRLDAAPITVEPNVWYNPELRTAVFIVPGLIGVILTMTMVMLTSMAIVRERERGTLEQLIVSPVKKGELVLGKIAPYITIGYVQITLVLLAGRFAFDMPIAGSLLLLYALAFVFIAANLAFGLFLSTLAKTQQQAMQMSLFFLLPNIVLSGFMFPFEGMPLPAQYVAQVLPLTHFLRIVRGITLKASELADLTSELLVLLGLLVGLMLLASLRFTKKLL